MATKLTSARFTTVVCALGLTLSIAGSARAQEAQDPDQNAPQRAAESPGDAEPRVIAATAPNARMAALIRAGGVIISQRGVARVRNPRTGIYCILPTAATGIIPN